MSLRGITKRFGDFTAVDSIDLDIHEGEFFTLLGPSGCGKTTTLRMLAGFEEPDAGEILLDGTDLVDVPAHKRPVNTVFQSYALFPFMTVADNVAFGLRYQSFGKQESRDKVDRALELVEMTSYAKRKPHQLSGGQQQRVALARALVLEPTVLLLDEPLGALDAKLRRQLQIELRQLQKRVGTTFVYVTHDQEEALTMSDRLAILVDGHVEQVGTPSEMYSSPATTYVAGFLGTANLFATTVTEVADGVATCAVDGLAVCAQDNGRLPVGASGSLVIRPERIEIAPVSEVAPDPAANVYPGRVRDIVFMGGQSRVSVQIGPAVEAEGGPQLLADVANVHGELPEWLTQGREVCTRFSHRAVQLLPH